MEKKIYEKTKHGYILRQRKTSAIGGIICVICLGLFALFEALVENEPQSLIFWVKVGAFLACVIITMVILRTEWCHMVIDENGIYFHRPLAKTKYIAWKDLRDWGIAHMRTSYSRVSVLYFSTEPLKLTPDGENKKMPLTYRKAVYISIEDDDFPALKCAGVISFCRRQLERNNTS